MGMTGSRCTSSRHPKAYVIPKDDVACWMRDMFYQLLGDANESITELLHSLFSA